MEIAFVPSWLLNLLNRQKHVQWNLNVLFSSMLIVSSILLTSLDHVANLVPHVCLVQYFFRVPCPGCGIIRSLTAFARLDLRTAWLNNPVGPFLGVFLCLQIPARISALLFEHLERAVIACSSVVSRVLVVGLLIVWLYRVLERSI
jgi:hypothetical protein